MPTYEYACRDCGHHLEVVQSFSDAPLTVCGHCGGGLRKVFSAAGIIFKGSGYYVTDTRSKAAKEPSGGGGGSGDGGSSSGERKDAGSTAAKSDSATSSGEAKSA
jgi:putative FmdB family regulatory protein